MAGASVYLETAEMVRTLIDRHKDTEPAVVCYMVARSAFLSVRAAHGADKAAELAYRLADGFAGEDRT